MDVHMYYVLFELIVLLIAHTPTFAKVTLRMCRYDCFISCPTNCDTIIKCAPGTQISIFEVQQANNDGYCLFGNCKRCCAGDVTYNTEYTQAIMNSCNENQTCDIGSFKPDDIWRLSVEYECIEPTTVVPNTTTMTVSTSIMSSTSVITPETKTTISTQAATTTATTDSLGSTSTIKSSISFSSSVPTTETRQKFTSKADKSAGLPLGATIAIPVGIVFMILIIVWIVCVVKRKSNRAEKDNQTDEKRLPMLDMTGNNNDNHSPSDNREHQQENHEQDYVDTHEGKNNSNHTVEQEYVDANQGGYITPDDDEYNTLNTHQPPVQIDPNYDHLPKDSHTTVDEAYSHVTDSQTAVPDATYSHLQDSKSNASNNVNSNQNNSNNVYNHINTLSVEDNVYSNTETKFTQNFTSNLSQIRAEEDDYDHTDWNQAKSQKPIASHNGATNKSVGDNITEEEYAVVNKRSDDKVKSNDGHNYFVLKKKSF